MDLEQYSVSGIDRIEVVEGGGSTLYGSGSIGGVINIIMAPQPARSAATLSTGSFNEQTYSFATPYLSFQRTYATNDYSVVNAPNRQNAQAGLTSVAARYSHPVGAIDLTFSGNLEDALVGTPGQLGFFSPTSEQGNVGRNLRLSAEHRGARSTTTLALGDSSEDLSYTCNTPVDSNCPNAFYPTPSPGSSSNPPYAQLLNDQHAMAALRNVSGDDRQRLVYGVDLMRGNARVDQGTGGGSAPYNPPVFYTYAQTAAYVQSQWFGRNGDQIYVGLARRTRRRHWRRVLAVIGRHRSFYRRAAAAPQRGDRVPRADGRGTLLSGLLQPQSRARTHACRRRNDRGAQLLGGVTFGWFTTNGSDLIVSPPPYYIPENVGHASIAGLSFTAQTLPFHHVVANLGITNLYRAQDLDNDTRLPGRGPVFAVIAGACAIFRRATAASTASPSPRERKVHRSRKIRSWRRSTRPISRRRLRRSTARSATASRRSSS